MPTTGTIAVFVAATLALIVLPGPANLFLLTKGIASGRKAAAVAAVGVDSASLVYVIATAAGLAALLASSAVAFTIVRYAGAAYLVYLGIKALRRKPGAPTPADGAVGGKLVAHYRQGFLVGIGNPKVALFFVSFLPQFVDPARGSPTVQVLVLGGIFVALGLLADQLTAAAAGALGRHLRRRQHLVARTRFVEGPMYLALATWAALGGARHARS